MRAAPVLLVIVVLGIVTIQVTAVCIWRLLTMVRRGTVFSHAAFRYVDVVIGAVAAPRCSLRDRASCWPRRGRRPRASSR